VDTCRRTGQRSRCPPKRDTFLRVATHRRSQGVAGDQGVRVSWQLLALPGSVGPLTLGRIEG